MRTNGPNRAAVSDDQHRLLRMLARDAAHRLQDPAAHLGVRLSSFPAPAGARSQLVVRAREALLDVILGQACPRAHIDLAQLAHRRDRQALPLPDDESRLVSAPEVAGVERAERHPLQLPGNRAGLLAAALVERD